MLRGNKGEWSEIYVFLKLLAEGRLNIADEKLAPIPDAYYPIIKILRQEFDRNRHYKVDDAILIIDGDDETELLNIPVKDFVYQSRILLKLLKEAKGRSFEIPQIEEFLHFIEVRSLTEAKGAKADIKLVVHDFKTGMEPRLDFSIKSMMGKHATLFNAGNTTNFIYEVIGNGSLEVEEINAIVTSPKILNRISEIRQRGFELRFRKIQSDTLHLNLQLIDSDLPQILAELLLIRFTSSGLSSLSELLEELTKQNPLNFDLDQGHPFYEFKIKNFLTDSALGMTPSNIWKGHYDATGGLIVVKNDGELVCYHIYNRNEFQNYLLNNTRLEMASTSRYHFGSLYKEEGRLYFKLNLQVRFT